MLTYMPLILSITGVIGVGGLILLLGLWPAVSSFLIGTKIGRAIAAAGALFLGLIWLFLSGKRSGIKGEQDKQRAASWRAIQERIKIDEEIRKMPISDRRNELRKWVRN